MVEIVLVWTLILAPYSRESVAVSNIASEQACLSLGEKIRPSGFLQRDQDQRYHCFSYETVVRR